MSSGQNNHYYVSITPKTIVWVFLIALLFFTAYILHDLLLVILTSVLLASAISPAARWFVGKKVPRVVAVIILYTGFLFGLAATFYFLLVPLFQETFSFIKVLPEYFEMFEDVIPSLEEKTSPQFLELAGDFSPRKLLEELQGSLAGIGGGFVGTLFTLFGGVFNFLLIIVLSFYLSVQENGVAKFLKMVTPVKHERYVLDLWKRAEMKMGYWMQGQLILAVIVAVLVYLCLTLLGIEHSLLLAFLAGVFELIPVFGPILAAIPALVIAGATGGTFMDPGFTAVMVVGGVYLIIQQFESQLIYPLVIRKVIGLSPIIVIISLIAGYQLAGFLGIVLSVPVAAIVMEFLNDMQSRTKPKVALNDKDASR
ncbi:MAG: AI-2E family transporter [Patescibacteria group bacterium]